MGDRKSGRGLQTFRKDEDGRGRTPPPSRFWFRAAGAEPLPELGVPGGPHAAQAVLPSRDCLGVRSAPWHVSGTWEEPAQTWGDHAPRTGPHTEVGFFLSHQRNSETTLNKMTSFKHLLYVFWSSQKRQPELSRGRGCSCLPALRQPRGHMWGPRGARAVPPLPWAMPRPSLWPF